MDYSQGSMANLSGQDGEAQVLDFCHGKKIPVMGFDQYVCNRHKYKHKLVAVVRYPYRSFFGSRLLLDLALICDDRRLLGIEVKNQNVAGSTDEKMGNVMLNGLHSDFDHYVCAALGAHWQSSRGQSIIQGVNNYAQQLLGDKFEILDIKQTCDKIRWVKENMLETNKANVKKLGYVGKQPGASKRDSDSWYTPVKYIDSARTVLGGIELDPFSSTEANKNVRAQKFFTEQDNALELDWNTVDCRTVWMNPPYGRLMGKAVDKFVQEYSTNKFDAAVVLCNNATDTKWFQRLYEKASAVCFTDHRIQFMNVDGKNVSGNTRGQIFVYFGTEREKFQQEFSQYGHVMYKLTTNGNENG